MHMKMTGGMKRLIVGLGFVVLMMIMMSLLKWMSGLLLIRTVNERRRIIKSKDISVIPKVKDFVVQCLNPEHDDRNPSMRIDQ